MTIKPNENPRQHQQRLQHQKRSSDLTNGFSSRPWHKDSSTSVGGPVNATTEGMDTLPEFNS